MVKDHLKRISAPKEWPIPRKRTEFVMRPLPGAHGLHAGMPLAMIMKDFLKIANTTSEAKKILNKKEVLIDGKRVKEKRRIVGLMDIISIPEIKEYFMIVLNKKGKLLIKNIAEKESLTKLSNVTSKKMEKGKIKLGTHDGRSIITDDPTIKTGDTLMLKLPEQKIQEIIKMEKGAAVYLIGGKYKGEIGKIEDMKESEITVNLNGKLLKTDKKSVFVLGKEKPAITI